MIFSTYAFITGISLSIRNATAAIINGRVDIDNGGLLLDIDANVAASLGQVIYNIGGLNWRLLRTPAVQLINQANVGGSLIGGIFYSIGD